MKDEGNDVAPVVERQPSRQFDYDRGFAAGDAERATLQSTIAQLQAENERNAKNSKDWEEASLHWMAERDKLQARVAELESGRGEPVYQLCNLGNGSGWRDADKAAFDSAEQLCGKYERRTLFTAPPAPVAVVLPERAAFEQFIIERDGAIWVTVFGEARSYNAPIERDYSVWQACLDATAALNGQPK